MHSASDMNFLHIGHRTAAHRAPSRPTKVAGHAGACICGDQTSAKSLSIAGSRRTRATACYEPLARKSVACRRRELMTEKFGRPTSGPMAGDENSDFHSGLERRRSAISGSN
jgi:hypothetical protein